MAKNMMIGGSQKKESQLGWDPHEDSKNMMVVGGFYKRELQLQLDRDPNRDFIGTIFVSHSQTQKEFSTLLFQALKDAHYSPILDELDDDAANWFSRSNWYHFIKKATEQRCVAILVLSNEFFTSKRSMMELNEFAKTQYLNEYGEVLNSKLKVLPLLLDMSFTEFDNYVRKNKWLKSWKDMEVLSSWEDMEGWREDMEESYNCPIAIKEWQRALSIIYDNMALIYENEGHPDFITKVVEAIRKLGEPMRFDILDIKPIQPLPLSFRQHFYQRSHQLDDLTVSKKALKVPPREVIAGFKKNSEEKLQGTSGEAISNTKASLHTSDKLVIRNPDAGEGSGIGKVDMIKILAKYFEIIEDCEKSVLKMDSQKFNRSQCEYLVMKLQNVVEVARLFLYTCQTQENKMYSIMKSERRVEIFKLLMILSKQVEGFFLECSKSAWMQVAMTLENGGEYVSTLGFNLELCKIAIYEEGSKSGRYTLEDVGELNDCEVLLVEPRVVDDKEFLLNKTTQVSHSTNIQSAKLANYLLVKLQGDARIPSIDDHDSNVFKMVFESFEYVKSMWGFGRQQIGRGASAKVYKVMWFDTPVAQKTFMGYDNPEFQQEVKVLSGLHHPNISSMFCCNMTRNACSIIMELMDGNLFDLLQTRTINNCYFHPFSKLEEIDLMLQVADGVNYLHRQRITHRDLKSDNILVKGVEIPNIGVAYLQAKVTDFGLSKRKETSISCSKMTYNVGTSRWMAPEIIKIRDSMDLECNGSTSVLKYNFKGDVYSFGMVCYEILTGEIPFHHIGCAKDVKMRVLNNLRPTLPEDCPERLAKLIKKCWSGEPKLRPSMNEICLELKYMKYLLLIGEVLE